MKLILLLSVALLLEITGSYAQTIDGIALKDLAVEYVEIVGQTKVLSNRQFVGIDYGQEKTSGLYPYRNMKIKDADGKDIQFNYMIEALNFMTKNGYEFIQAYTSIKEGQSVYHYLLKKKN